MFWFALMIWAVTTVVYELVRPKPKFEDARPASLGDFQFPTATEGRAIPIVWGQVKIKGPNLIWYGNFFKRAQTEDIKTGIWSSETVITHYRYYVGMQFALCHGPIDSLDSVWVNDKVTGVNRSTSGGFTINKPSLFGGEEHGSGGMVGDCSVYMGSYSESVNGYLDSKQSGTMPAFRGTAHVVWEAGWIGNSPSVAPWAFEVTRIPDGLNLESYIGVGGSQPNTGDCNPMNVLHEMLTDTDWGLSIPAGDIDTTNFQEVAETLHDEGNGFALVVDRATQITSLIDEIQRQIDGSLYFDRAQGQWKVKLARDDYTPSSLTTLDESNILELKEFTRQTWEETTNQVRVAYNDRSDEYKDTFAFAQDPANMDIQGQTVQSDVSYPGCKDRALAQKLAWRDLRALSYPLAKIKITVNRGMWAAAPGSLFRLSWSRLGLVDVVFRVGKINYGKVGDSKIEIFAIQDVFAAATAVYGTPVGSGWDEPTDDPAYATAGNTLIFEAPKQLIAGNPYSGTQNPRLWMGCRFPGDGTTTMMAWNKADSTSPPGGSYAEDVPVQQFMLTGTLNADLPSYGSTAVRPATSYNITINEVDDLEPIIVDGASSLIQDKATICYCNGEFFGFEKAEDLGGGQIRLSRLWRGLFDSAPKAHSATSTVYFISAGGSLTKRYITASQDEVRTQLRGRNGDGDETTELATPEIDTHLNGIFNDPLPPRDPYLNGVYADRTAVSVDQSYTTETGRTGDDARALEISYTPRDWHENDPTVDDTLTANWTTNSPYFELTLTLDPTGTPVDVGPYTTTGGDATPEQYVLRNDIIIALGANTVIPTDADLSVVAKHNSSGSQTAQKEMTLEDIAIVSTTLQGNDDVVHGGVDDGTSPAAVIYGETGIYSFDIHYQLPTNGILEARINGGTWLTVVTSNQSTGSLSVTAGDSVELRRDVAPSNGDQFFDIVGPTAEKGYGVLLS
jgi:hypothetical protein